MWNKTSLSYVLLHQLSGGVNPIKIGSAVLEITPSIQFRKR